MSQIDIQNAKQIRDPMTVLISMEVPEDVAVTYSGFENVKIEDAQLGQRAWPMRQLADLQGEGFALDGSRVLYDPSVTASAANGKIGIRGDVGEDVTFTVSGDSNINGLSLAATGTDRVLFNGQTATFSDGQVIIPVGSDSITLTFPAEETDRRVEVSFTLPGTSLKVTNDSIISCIVSLRSDLSIEDPTLPESELNVDIYNDVDISEAVASIPDDSPLIYSAGYPGDMSPDRKFYVAGQITWADNVLSIHAVDAVHFLDREFAPYDIFTRYTISAAGAHKVMALIAALTESFGVEVGSAVIAFQAGAGVDKPPREEVYFPRGNLREVIAFLNNVFKIDDVPRESFDYNYPETVDNAYWFNYVDAGIPYLTNIKPSAKWTVNEEDCGDNKKNIDSAVGSVSFMHTIAQINEKVCGSVTWQKDGPAYPNFDCDVYGELRFRSTGYVKTKNYNLYKQIMLPATTRGGERGTPINEYAYINILVSSLRPVRWGYPYRRLIDEGTLQNVEAYSGGNIYTQILPDNAYSTLEWKWPELPNQKAVWDGLIAAGEITAKDTSVELEAWAEALDLIEEEKKYQSGTGTNVYELKGLIYGDIYFGNANNENVAQAYPDMAMESLLKRSNVTGSFTWKGDPRMQPRDVVNFHRLDGSVETITLENITLHHEGGGTYAEITYRKGVC